jgi:quercetin dioxygenase-like cupin family protein
MVTANRVGSSSTLGLSSFASGTHTDMLRHGTEELAFVLTGTGELRLDSESVSYQAGSAIFIPAGVWHSVANTGVEPVTMVFAFPHPDYPPTDHRPVESESA